MLGKCLSKSIFFAGASAARSPEVMHRQKKVINNLSTSYPHRFWEGFCWSNVVKSIEKCIKKLYKEGKKIWLVYIIHLIGNKSKEKAEERDVIYF